MDISLYISSTKTLKQTITCTNNPCTANFATTSVDQSGAYYIIAAYSDPAEYQLTIGSAGRNIRFGKLTITGSNSARASPTLIRITTTIGNYRYHRLYVPVIGDVVATVKFAALDAAQ